MCVTVNSFSSLAFTEQIILNYNHDNNAQKMYILDETNLWLI